MSRSETYVTTDEGVRLFVETRGDGPQPVIVPNGIYLIDDFAPLIPGRTLIFYDPRNRGRSDRVEDVSTVARGVLQDVSDLDAVRRSFGIAKASLIGHSYVGFLVALYARAYPDAVERVVQMGPMEPHPGKIYPAHLTCADDTSRDVFRRLGELQPERASLDPAEFCRRAWAILRFLYVVDPADADLIRWGRCDLPNERGFMKYWTEVVLPSIRNLEPIEERAAKVEAPVLIIHGTKDRSAPYGGGREWALLLPNARLVTVDDAGHAPWIEAPAMVFGAMAAFLDGRWPETASKIESLEP
jgi:proline iminopeptidase